MTSPIRPVSDEHRHEPADYELEPNELAADVNLLRDIARRIFENTTPAMGFDGGDVDGLTRIAASLATRPAKGDDQLDCEWTKRRIRELTDEGDGFWRPCSGCQESSDGYVSSEDYPYSDLFQCQPGSGCGECGGIGVTWDDTDYAAWAEDFALTQAPRSCCADERERCAKIIDDSAAMFRKLGQDARAHDLEFEAARIRNPATAIRSNSHAG